MAENSIEPTPRGMTRKNFLRWGTAGVAGGVITHALPRVVNSIEFTSEMHRIDEAGKVLFARLGMSGGGVFNITSDHIAYSVSPDAVLMGETHLSQLYITQDYVDRTPDEETFYPNGFEYFGRIRTQLLYNSIQAPKLVISTDGDAMYSQKYIEADAASASTIHDLVMKLYDIAPMVSFGGTLAASHEMTNLKNAKMARRTFLKILGIGGAGGVATQLIGKGILPNLDLADLHDFPPLWQHIIHLLPFKESVLLRNKIMTANMNALTAVPLYVMTQKAHIFAGGGHREMASEILRKPAEVREDLHRFLIGDKTNKGIFYNLFDLYDQATNAEDRDTVAAYTIDALGSLFAPVKIRVNYTKMRDDLGAFRSMQQSYSIYEKNEATGSAFMILIRALKELDDRLTNHTDPFLQGKAVQAAQGFFQRVMANWVYPSDINQPNFLHINTKEQFFIGYPVAFQKDQEQFSLFGRLVSVERGFVTNVEGPPGEKKGKG